MIPAGFPAGFHCGLGIKLPPKPPKTSQCKAPISDPVLLAGLVQNSQDPLAAGVGDRKWDSIITPRLIGVGWGGAGKCTPPAERTEKSTRPAQRTDSSYRERISL